MWAVLEGVPGHSLSRCFCTDVASARRALVLSPPYLPGEPSLFRSELTHPFSGPALSTFPGKAGLRYFCTLSVQLGSALCTLLEFAQCVGHRSCVLGVSLLFLFPSRTVSAAQAWDISLPWCLAHFCRSVTVRRLNWVQEFYTPGVSWAALRFSSVTVTG